MRKYHEYAHGDPKGNRRVVLDSDTIPRILGARDIRVVPRDILLERFMATLREQVNIAANNDEHLVLLIFGHGTVTHGVPVGGRDGGSEPVLRMEDVRRVLHGAQRKETPVTLFITSCYSGGWLVKPDINRQLLRATAITASGDETETSSWSLSRSVGRASGSLAASAVLRCLIDNENLHEQTDDPTYIQFAHSVYESVKGMGLLGSHQEIYFSAENDEWESSYRRRLGLPLSSYETRWLSLRSLSPSSYSGPSSPGNSSSGPSSSGPAQQPLARTGGRRIKRLQCLATEYFASHPGRDEFASNIGLHNNLKAVLKGATYPKNKLDDLRDTVAYRLGAMHEAEYLREQAGIRYVSIFKTDNFWELMEHRNNGTLYGRTFSLLLEREILTPSVGIRLFYPKPIQYLAVALVSSSTCWENIEAKVQLMASKKKQWYRWVYKAYLGNLIAHDDGVMSHRNAFVEALKKVAHHV